VTEVYFISSWNLNFQMFKRLSKLGAGEIKLYMQLSLFD